MAAQSLYILTASLVSKKIATAKCDILGISAHVF